MSDNPTSTDNTASATMTAADSAAPGTATCDAVISEADADTLEGRTRVTLPPRSPDPAEALAEQQATQVDPVIDTPPTYAEMAHLMPR